MRAAGSALLAVLMLSLSGVPANAAWDDDGDGLRNAFENQGGVTSASDPDSDGDGVVDSAEDNDRDRVSNRGEQKYGTDPGNRDSDGDGIPDGREDADGDGRSNATEQDHRPVPAGLTPSLAAAQADVSPYKAGCQATNRSSVVVTCSYGPADSPTTIVLMGDSHAMQLATPLVTVAEENGWRLTTLVKKACPPVLGIHNRAQRWVDDGDSCRQWRRKALAWLRANPPDHIILAHSDGYAISTFDGRRIVGDHRAVAWRDGMKRTLAQMPDASQVLLLGDTPYNRLNPVACLERNRKNISKCVTSRQPLHKRTIELALEQAAKAKGARYRRFYDKVCSYDPCPIIQGDVLMYRDRGHITATFARQLTPTFRSMLTAFIAPTPAARRKG
jgi:SGNH domain (fused to AT3 domains)